MPQTFSLYDTLQKVFYNWFVTPNCIRRGVDATHEPTLCHRYYKGSSSSVGLCLLKCSCDTNTNTHIVKWPCAINTVSCVPCGRLIHD